MSKLPSEIEEYFKTANIIKAHLAKSFIKGYLEGILGERTGKHTYLTDDETAILGLEKAKEHLKKVRSV